MNPNETNERMTKKAVEDRIEMLAEKYDEAISYQNVNHLKGLRTEIEAWQKFKLRFGATESK